MQTASQDGVDEFMMDSDELDAWECFTSLGDDIFGDLERPKSPMLTAAEKIRKIRCDVMESQANQVGIPPDVTNQKTQEYSVQESSDSDFDVLYKDEIDRTKINEPVFVEEPPPMRSEMSFSKTHSEVSFSKGIDKEPMIVEKSKSDKNPSYLKKGKETANEKKLNAWKNHEKNARYLDKMVSEAEFIDGLSNDNSELLGRWMEAQDKVPSTERMEPLVPFYELRAVAACGCLCKFDANDLLLAAIEKFKSEKQQTRVSYTTNIMINAFQYIIDFRQFCLHYVYNGKYLLEDSSTWKLKDSEFDEVF